MELDELHGKHVPQANDEELDITWLPVQPSAERVKVRDYTCDCRPVFYELCQAGGVRFIRRTTRVRGKLVIEESTRSPAAYVDALWSELLGIVDDG
jgi:hypothetical protein